MKKLRQIRKELREALKKNPKVYFADNLTLNKKPLAGITVANSKGKYGLIGIITRRLDTLLRVYVHELLHVYNPDQGEKKIEEKEKIWVRKERLDRKVQLLLDLTNRLYIVKPRRKRRK